MAHAGRAASLQPVEVVESSTDDVRARPDRGSDPEGGPDAQPRRWSRSRVLLLVVVVLVLVVALLAVLDGQRRAAARRDALAVPGLLLPVDGPVHEQWRVRAEQGAGAVLVGSDAVVAVTADADAWRLTAYDEESGEPRWTAEVAAQGPGIERGDVMCPSHLGRRVDSLVLCVRVEPGAVYQDQAPDEIVATDVVDVLAYDLTSGRRVGTWRVEGEFLDAERVDDDLVVAMSDAEGRTHVERRAGTDGTVRWAYVSRTRLFSQLDVNQVTIETTEQVAVVRGADIAVLRLSDGHAHEVASRLVPLAVAPFRDGYATWTPLHGGVVVDARGDEVAQVPALPTRLRVDDGSGEGYALTMTGSAVVAVGLATGDEAWRLVTNQRPVGVVDGTAVVAEGPRVSVLDVARGTELWSYEIEQWLPWEPVSDGALLLVPGDPAGLGGPWVVVACDVRDGQRVWQVELPRDVRSITAVGGLLLGRTPDGVALLR